jgi:hypothetical protein
MNANRHKAVVELYSNSDRNWKERVADVLDRYSMTLEELEAATDEVLVSGNDIEGAAIGIAAVNLAYPDHDSSEYFKARVRILNQTCLLWRLQDEPEFPVELEHKMVEMLDIIDDGAERIAGAGCPLAT